MNFTELVGRLLGVEKAVDIGDKELSLSAPWAHNAPSWLLFGCLGLVTAAILFYTRYQYARQTRSRMVLAVARAVLLCLLLLILAEPVLTIRITSQLKPALWLLFDGTESMAICDDLSQAERAEVISAVGMPAEVAAAKNTDPAARPSRAEYVKALLANQDGKLLTQLADKFRLRAFLFDRPESVQGLESAADGEGRLDPKRLGEQLTTSGQVTALGDALSDLGRRQATSNLAGVVVFSDFNKNHGASPVDEAKRLGVSVYTVGVGPATAFDLAVTSFQCMPRMKKDERFSLVATLRQEGFSGRTATVKFSVRKQEAGQDASAWRLLEQRDLRLDDSVQTVEIPYVPKEVGRFSFRAEVDPFPEETIPQNNQAECKTVVHDEPMRVLFVEYEPSWEWRFVKEVFHRDKLVGPKGFRTYLASANPKVRESNELYVPTLTSSREQFFQHDVIILSDMPASALGLRFFNQLEEFVYKLGGGLVVVAGPRFGPGQLAMVGVQDANGERKLSDLLPVKVDPELHIQSRHEFLLRRQADAVAYDFMHLETPGAPNEKAWATLGPLPWYQPVRGLSPTSTALAVHPTEKCADGSPQPIVAVRRFGNGEVVYVGFNEMWRLRRSQGERYYRAFWGQLIHRLASRHALGAEKRFVVTTDREDYRPNDKVFLRVAAYDEGYKPLGDRDVPGGKLTGQLILPQAGASEPPKPQPISIPMTKEGVFETRVPVFAGGEYRLRVFDPIKKENVEVPFRVVSVSVERERATRDARLQKDIADATGGKTYDLTTVANLADEVHLPTKTETNVEVIALWNTWLVFGVVAFLMLGEWLGRKWVNLP